jgi:flagellar motility protein MotE (MotC chaperone)
MVDEVESTESEKVPEAAPIKSKLPLLAGAIGLLLFIVFIAVFSVSMGVFSSSNVVPGTEQAEDAGEPLDEAEAKDETRDFHPSYYEDYATEESPSAEDSLGQIAEEDSLSKMAWYEKQKREIESEKRKIELERRELETLKYETMNLLDQRKNIEDANAVQMAKLFDSMKAAEIAAILANMTDQQVGMILMKMKKQNASKVLAAMPAERAAQITSQMMNLAEGY